MAQRTTKKKPKPRKQKETYRKVGPSPVPRVLLIDIETAPNLSYTWGLFDQTISIDAVAQTGYTLCYAAKWHDEKKIAWDSVNGKGGREGMIRRVHALMGQADAIISYNGDKFDIPKLNQEFLALDMHPPTPTIQMDLLKTIRNKFKLTSNKLDFVARHLGIPGKVRHKGWSLWTGCMHNIGEDWRLMKEYNMNDVVVLERVYKKVLPWINTKFNWGLHVDSDSLMCKNCGSSNVQRRGYSLTQTSAFVRYQCQGCGKWQRSSENVIDLEKRRTLLRDLS